MRKITIIISLLVAVIIVSNVWWAYAVFDAGISYTYLQQSYRGSQEALSQALAIIKVTATPGVSQGEIIEAAQNVVPTDEPFEKEGFLWVGSLGLRFDKQGQLVEAVRNF